MATTSFLKKQQLVCLCYCIYNELIFGGMGMVIITLKFKKMKAFFNNMKLHNKLILSYIFVALLPVFIIGYFLVSKTEEIAFTNAESINLVDSRQMEENIINQLKLFLNKADSILDQPMLMDYIQTQHNYDSDYLSMFNAYQKIISNYGMSLPITLSSITKLRIYTSNITIVHDNSFILKIDALLESEPWYKEVYAAEGRSIFLPPYTIKGDQFIKDGIQYISVGKSINPFLHNNITNILRIDIPESELYKLIEKNGANKQIYILNDKNLIVSSTDRSSLGKNAKNTPYLNNIMQHFTKNGINKLENQNNFISFKEITDKSSINGWRILSIVPLTPMSNSISSIVKYSLLICGLSIAVTLLFVFFFSKTLTGRLEELTRNMSKIDEGNFEVFVNYKGHDEIAILSKSFKKMIEKVNTLINEVYLLDIEKKQAEINALQSQINPHFLFNTMESIRMNLWIKKDYETSEIVQQFAKLLRKAIEWEDDKIPLKQEMELICIYLNIQKFRYKDKFTYEIRIDDTLINYIIPKFTLQPIVENAIYHGIEMKKGTGLLEIYSEVTENHVKIIVKDDGIGIDSEKLQFLKDQLSRNNPRCCKDRIGIWNVNQRLRLFFGPEYGINIDSQKDLGTTFEILLPKTLIKEISNV